MQLHARTKRPRRDKDTVLWGPTQRTQELAARIPNSEKNTYVTYLRRGRSQEYYLAGEEFWEESLTEEIT